MKVAATVTCPCGCGHTFWTEISVNTPRHNPTGEGYHAAKLMTCLSFGEVVSFEVLLKRGCFSPRTGLQSREVWIEAKDLYASAGRKWPMLDTIRPRLSALQGLGMAKCENVRKELLDQPSLQFRHEGEIRWYIPDGGLDKYELFPKTELSKRTAYRYRQT